MSNSIGITEIIVVLIGLALSIGLFLLLRRVVLWYWGITAMQNHLEELVRQNNQLITLLSKQAGPPSPGNSAPPRPSSTPSLSPSAVSSPRPSAISSSSEE